MRDEVVSKLNAFRKAVKRYDRSRHLEHWQQVQGYLHEFIEVLIAEFELVENPTAEPSLLQSLKNFFE